MHVYLAMFVVESHARDASSIHLFSASLILLLFFFFFTSRVTLQGRYASVM